MMSNHPTQRAGSMAVRRPLAAAALAVLSLAAQAQDPGKALSTLQQLLRPAQGGAAPANVVPALAVAPKGAAQAGQMQDLFQLLSQAGDTIDEPREIEIGRQLAAVLLGSKPLHPDAALQRYVNQLGRWISLQTTRPELPWTFAVLDDVGYNAFAAPGGYVFVTKGLIDRVGDEAELAGILAHEITHVVQRHHLKALRKTARAGALTQLIGSQLNNNLGGALSAQLLALGRNLYAKGLDQEDEFEADRMGIALAASAGFDPYGLMAALQPLRAATADNPAFALTLSTHPPAQARMDLAELAMGNRLDALSGKPSVTVAQRLQLIAAAEPRRNATAAATVVPAAVAPAPSATPSATPSAKPAAKPAAKPTAKPATPTTRKTP